MSQAKEIRRRRAEERGRDKEKNDAVLAERDRCASICEVYAEMASRNGLIVHSQISRELATEIRNGPA